MNPRAICATIAVEIAQIRSTGTVTSGEVVKEIRVEVATPNQELKFPNGDRYVGQVRDGKPHGRGTIFYREDDEIMRRSYEGDFFDGKRQGWGTCLYREGSSWIKIAGQWQDNQAEGYVEVEVKSGHVYKGNWSNGVMEGQGVLYYPPDSPLIRYRGEFKNGRKSGQGLLFRRNKWTYRGSFYRDSITGLGEWKNERGAFAAGEFRDNVLYNGEKRYREWDDEKKCWKYVHYIVHRGQSWIV